MNAAEWTPEVAFLRYPFGANLKVRRVACSRPGAPHGSTSWFAWEWELMGFDGLTWGESTELFESSWAAIQDFHDHAIHLFDPWIHQKRQRRRQEAFQRVPDEGAFWYHRNALNGSQ